MTGGKCCLRSGSAQLTAPECEKSTATSMARWIRQLLPHLLSHRCPGRLFTVRSNQLSRPDSGANLGRETSTASSRSWLCAPPHNHHHPHLIRADTTPAPHSSHLVLLLKVSPTHHPSFNTLDIIYYDTRVPRAYMIPKSHTWNSFTSKCE